jgi:hypothetical protein
VVGSAEKARKMGPKQDDQIGASGNPWQPPDSSYRSTTGTRQSRKEKTAKIIVPKSDTELTFGTNVLNSQTTNNHQVFMMLVCEDKSIAHSDHEIAT